MSDADVEITPETTQKLLELREPFAPEYVAYRPQPYCKACSDAQYKVCNNHRRVQCQRCKQSVTSAHIDLAYIGHAETTDRLLKSDPQWSWEPLHREIDPHILAAAATSGNPEVVKAVMESAPPKLDQYGGLWIKLTVHGVTRLGYGDAQGKKPGPNAIKEIIGDAIRNAAMRFGVGIDLWSKSDMGQLEAEAAATRAAAEQDLPSTPPAARPPTGPFQLGGTGSGSAPTAPPAAAGDGYHLNGNGHRPNGTANGHAPPPPPQYAPETQSWLDTIQADVDRAVSPGALDNLLAIAEEGCTQHRCTELLPRMRAHIDQRRATLNAPVDPETLRSMHIALSNAKVKSGDDHKVAASRISGRRYMVATTNDLTFAEAVAVTLAARAAGPGGLDLNQFPVLAGSQRVDPTAVA